MLVAGVMSLRVSVATPDSLTAGLPLEDGRLTPALVPRAAERAGLTARVVKTTIAEIQHVALPAILLMNQRGACVLVEKDEKQAQIVLPELAEASRQVTLAIRFMALFSIAAQV